MGAGGNFIEQFIDDYFSEAEEHLATVRRVLLDLERSASGPPDPASIQELLRALHTLKGLSGMVGLGAAEEVAHAMEDAVRALLRDRRSPPALIELCFAGEALLEACIEARRANAMPPSPGPFVDRMNEVLHSPHSKETGMSVATTSETAVHWPSVPAESAPSASRKFEFTPSAELMARGVGVEVARQRVAQVGEIIATVPRVRPGGGVVFEFTVAAREGLLPDDAWRQDGMTWEDWSDEGPTGALGVMLHAARGPGSASSTAAANVSNVVRVDLSRLDDLMRMVGELVVARARLGEFVAQANAGTSAALWEDLNDTNEAIERQVRLIREGVMRVRLVAVNEVFERMRFAMRDIARETKKDIRLEFSGQETEIDKLVVDRMLEPLLHLVRNAASHGIENREVRTAAGKDPEGTIWLRARAAGDRMMIEVQDDGAGIDPTQIIRRAKGFGITVADDSLSSEAMLDILCAPGFSTRESADLASGRGVGMAVVRSTIRGLGGDLTIESAPGRGTRFTLELPLTLMITDALIVEIGDQAMAVPQTALREILPFDPDQVTRFERNEVMSYRGRAIPLVNVGNAFNLVSRHDARRHVLIVGSDAQPAGLIVDAVLGLREIVVHPVNDPMIAVSGIGGATELADGRVSLIIDAGALVRESRARAGRTEPESAWA